MYEVLVVDVALRVLLPLQQLLHLRMRTIVDKARSVSPTLGALTCSICGLTIRSAIYLRFLAFGGIITPV